MGIIDSGGRLFGKLNVIDLGVIILIVLLAFATYNFITSNRETENPCLKCEFIKKGSGEIKNEKDVIVRVFLEKMPEYIFDSVSVGDNVIKQNTIVLSVIYKGIIAKKKIDINESNLSKNDSIQPIQPYGLNVFYDFVLEILVRVDEKEGGLYYDDKLLKIEQQATFKLKKVDVTGKIIAIEEKE